LSHDSSAFAQATQNGSKTMPMTLKEKYIPAFFNYLPANQHNNILFCKSQILNNIRLIAVCIIALVPLLTQSQNKLIFTPHWIPQAQFAGYYVAQDQGFYNEAGLDVEIVHPSASVNALKFLKEGKSDIISLFLISGLDAFQNGDELVNIAQISQHSAIMFVTKKSSGISSLEYFQGKKVGIWRSGFHEVPEAMLKSNGIEVEWIPILSTVNLFLLGGIDAMTVMWYNEFHQIYLSGLDMDELYTFFMSDYGYNVPEDGLYALKTTVENRKDDLSKFVQATMKGWEYAAANRKYTVDLVVKIMRDAKIPSNVAHQQWMLDKILRVQSITNKEVRPTELLKSDYEKAVEIIESLSGQPFRGTYEQFFIPVSPDLIIE